MKYTLEEIEAALDAVLPSPYHSSSATDALDTRSRILAELTTPKPEFKEGQVVFYPYMEDDQPTGEYINVGCDSRADAYSDCRPLTLQEAGPDFVRREDVEPLIVTLDAISKGPSNTTCWTLASTTLCNLPDYLRGDDD